MGNTSSGSYSLTVGTTNTASGLASLAAGGYNTASGSFSFTWGEHNNVSGYTSSALGYYNIAAGNYQTAVGKYSASDTSSLFIVGGGTSTSARKNVFTVDAGGNVRASGKVLDTVTTSGVTLGSSIVTSNSTYTIRYAKSGHVVHVEIYCRFNVAVAAYSTLNSVATGLPKGYGYMSSGLEINGTAGTVLAKVDSNGVLSINTRWTALSANTYIVGGFTYISSE